TSHPSVDFFEMHVPIKLIGANDETTFTLNNIWSGQQYVLYPNFQVEQVQFDPDLWILSENTVLYDPSSNVGSEELLVSPNPATDAVRILILNPLKTGSSAEILDMQGKVVQTYQSATPIRDSFEMDVSSLAEGTYMVRLIDQGQSTSTRFVVSRN
ncbi:MAG TPA: T9SS type A sorting domain-containing protein, partial [Cryomorphaceae bacterium]|nr:T9SS type A sorting domain-containing protein [Cryomorphaceae bacterium]